MKWFKNDSLERTIHPVLNTLYHLYQEIYFFIEHYIFHIKYVSIVTTFNYSSSSPTLLELVTNTGWGVTLAHVAKERTGPSEVCQGWNESCDFEKTSVMLCCCWVPAFYPNILFASTQAKELGSFWNKSNIHFYGYGSSTMHTGNIYLPAENWKTKQSWCIHTHIQTHTCMDVCTHVHTCLQIHTGTHTH